MRHDGFFFIFQNVILLFQRRFQGRYINSRTAMGLSAMYIFTTALYFPLQIMTLADSLLLSQLCTLVVKR